MDQLIMIGAFTVATVLTVYYWMDQLRPRSAMEGFADPAAGDAIGKLQAAIAAPPSDSEANEAYMTLLRYIRDNPDNGLKFVFHMGDLFFGENARLKRDLDLQRILDNYIPPLQKK